MVIIGLVLASVAALVHVFIFWLESFAWTSPRARATFGTSEADAQATREMAYNQGFYNLFLAILVAVGVIFFATGATAPGAALVFAGAGSMTAASLVLLLSSPEKASAALKQGVIPTLGVVALAIGLLI
jgi:putative membrane protein